MLGFFLPLLRLSFWFNKTAVPFSSWVDRLLLVVFLVCVVCGAGVYVVVVTAQRRFQKDTRRLLRSVGVLSFWSGVVGLLLYAMTWQSIPVLSMRFGFILWLIVFGYWAWVLLRRELKELPLLRAEEAERAAYEKWLPKPKKK